MAAAITVLCTLGEYLHLMFTIHIIRHIKNFVNVYACVSVLKFTSQVIVQVVKYDPRFVVLVKSRGIG